jgi:adenine deaminase
MNQDTLSSLQKRIRTAQGKTNCDLVLRNATVFDVFHCQWRKGDIAISDGIILSLEPGLKGEKEIDLKGASVVPGFIDAHVHIESSLMVPFEFEKAVLERGTTTAICDPHELANVFGVKGIQYFLEASEKLAIDLWVMLSSCVPATHLETNGAGIIEAIDLAPLASHPHALGLAEVMNVPGVLNGDPLVLDKILAFSGAPIDGHSPLLRGRALDAYLNAGIESCHESTELAEAEEKISKGMSVWIREGSVAKDLDRLIPALNLATSIKVGFCTDDRNPLDIAREGHIDYLVRSAIAKGIAPEIVFRSASWSVAQHYNLVRGPNRVGALAPGFQADFVVLGDVKTCAIQSVYKKGILSSEMPYASGADQSLQNVLSQNSIHAEIPEANDLEGPQGQVHVMRVIPGKIITGREVLPHNHPEVLKISVLERYGKKSKPANAYASGFGKNFKGAIASSVGHDSHNLIVVGSNTADMRVALAKLKEEGGGFCVVQNQKALACLPLPFGGLMSRKTPKELKKDIETLQKASHSIGCELADPFLQLAFLSLPVIPTLKITDKGLVDVDRFEFISVRA